MIIHQNMCLLCIGLHILTHLHMYQCISIYIKISLLCFTVLVYSIKMFVLNRYISRPGTAPTLKRWIVRYCIEFYNHHQIYCTNCINSDVLSQRTISGIQILRIFQVWCLDCRAAPMDSSKNVSKLVKLLWLYTREHVRGNLNFIYFILFLEFPDAFGLFLMIYCRHAI